MFRVAKYWVMLLLCGFGLAGQVSAKVCDLDGDGDVDLDDIVLLQRLLPSRPTVTGPDDPRDADGNGRIDILDARACVLRCTRPKCSTLNQAPLANAGPDQSILLGSLVTLDGSASRDPEGASLSYAWSLIGKPPGSNAVLSGGNHADSHFTADFPGEYLVQLTVHDGQLASATDTIRITVSNTPPTVSLSSPANGTNYTAPATITLTATATDSDGSIARVEFYQGGTLISGTTAAPYSVTWSNVPAGSYSLTAKATDDQGAATTTAARAVTVTAAAGPTRIYYLHTDHLNTPRVVTDEANRVVWRNLPVTEPFGMSLPEEDPDGDGQPFILNLRFPGQYADRESNLNYNYFRDYDPETGRYLQSDPIGLAGGVNTYGYVGGNPLSLSDPLGLDNPGIGPYGGGRRPMPPNSFLSPGCVENAFWSNYFNMRTANTIGADKYFHCKANCESSRCGSSGPGFACLISDAREFSDQYFKGDPASASVADQVANEYGRKHAQDQGTCAQACSPFRPRGLPASY